MNDKTLFSSDNRNSHVLSVLFRNGKSEAYVKGTDFDPFQIKNDAAINLISYGYVKVLGYDKDGRESVHLIYGKGDIFPLLNLIRPVNLKGITYKALTDVRLLSLSAETLYASIKTNLECSNAIVERMLIQFSQTLDRLENKCCKTAEEKVVYCLLFLGARFGLKNGNSIRLENIFTHELTGKMIGLTRETVSREYEKLRKKGLVDTPPNEIILNDVKALTRIVDAPLSLCILQHNEIKE